MIFILHQLQDKSREQNTPLLIAFVDLYSNRGATHTALVNIGYALKLLSLINSYHEAISPDSIVIVGVSLEPFEVHRDIQQDCVLAPTLLGIFFSRI